MKKYYVGVLVAVLLFTCGALPGNAQGADQRQTIAPILSLLLAADAKNVVVVAKSGGDYSSVQTAINNIIDASASNAYLV